MVWQFLSAEILSIPGIIYIPGRREKIIYGYMGEVDGYYAIRLQDRATFEPAIKTVCTYTIYS